MKINLIKDNVTKNIDQILELLKGDFYICPESEQFHYHDEKNSGRSYFDPMQRLMYGRGPWVTSVSSASNSTMLIKKKLLFIGGDHNLHHFTSAIKEFSNKGFQNYFLNKQGQLINVTSLAQQNQFSKIYESLALSLYIGHKELAENKLCHIEQQLRKNGENPQNWHIIDDYEFNKLIYISSLDFFDKDNLWENFFYSIKINHLSIDNQKYLNDLVGKQIKKINKLTLSRLSLMNCDLFINLFPKLHTIAFIECEWDVIAYFLTTLKKIPTIKIKNLELKTVNMETQLPNCIINSLQSLTLDNIDIDPTYLEPLQLTSLTIKECFFTTHREIDDRQVPYVSCLQITELSLYLAKDLSTADLYFITQFTNLKTLNLYFKPSDVAHTINFGGTEYTAERLISIKNVTINSSNSAHRTKIKFISRPWGLKSFKFNNIDITDFLNLQNYRELINLSFNNCNFHAFPELPKNLAVLYISDCEIRFFDLTQQYINSLYPQLKIIGTQKKLDDKNLETKVQHDIASPIQVVSPSTNRILDSRTQIIKDKKLTVNYAIYEYQDGKLTSNKPIDPCRYRHTIYDQIQWHKQSDQAYLTNKIEESTIIPESEIKTLERITQFTEKNLAELKGKQYFVEVPLVASDQWQPLPDLSAYDVISKIALPENSLIRFNKRNNQYEILFKPGSANQDFTLVQYLFSSELADPLTEEFENILPTELIKILDQLLNFSAEPADACAEFIELRPALKAIRYLALQQKLEFCQTILREYFARDNFGNTELTATEPKRSIFESILIEGTGACRHRAIVFMGLCQYLGLTVRYIENEVHAYVEIYNGKIWQRIDLGGYETQIEENFSKPLTTGMAIAEPEKSNTPELKQEQGQKTNQEGQEEKEQDLVESCQWDSYFSPDLPEIKIPQTTTEVLTQLSQQKNSLLKLDNLQKGRDLYAALVQLDEKKPIYYIESCDDITGQWKMVVVRNGKLEMHRIAPLKELVTQTGGMLIINWAGKFTDSEMASLMSIMDKDEPKLMGEPIAKNLQLLNLVSPKMQLPDRFYSRSNEFTWPEGTPYPENQVFSSLVRDVKDPHPGLAARPLPQAGEVKESLAVPLAGEAGALGPGEGLARVDSASGYVPSVDLYGDQNGQIKNEQWRRELLGYLDIQGDQYTYIEGALAQALHSKKPGLELIDAPWHDPTFQCFMTRLSVEKRVFINGEYIFIPDGFTFSSRSAEPTKWPAQLIKEKAPEKWQPDLKNQDVFYLNHSTFNMLFHQQKVDAAGKIYTLPGWLFTKNSGKAKQIILTETLSAVEMRRIANALQEEPSPGPSGPTSPASGKGEEGAPRGEISWVDLTTINNVIPAASVASRAGIQASIPVSTGSQLCSQSSLPGMTSPSSLSEMTAVGKIKSARIILVEDPYFWAQQLKQKDDVLINIHEDTSASELLESVKEIKSKDQSSFRFQHRLLAMADALLAGENVILYGQLSADLYYTALESLLAQQAQLKLFNQEQVVPTLGKLTIISKSLDFEPKLALQQQTIAKKTGIVWEEYEKTINHQDFENFHKIKLFYQLAKTIPHNQVGTPEKLNITFQQLQLCLQALREEKTDKPIKAFFQHQYQHNTENYAQLNVIAKVLFGQESKIEGVRLAKLESYPNQSEYIWRRLNCLNPTALRKILLPEGQEFSQLIQLNLDKVRTRFAYWLGFQKSNLEFKAITRNLDPQLKAQENLKTKLAKHNIALLKGPPGSGKTYIAFRYAKQVGKQCFVGQKNIESWLEAKLKDDEEAILILDEANLKKSGHWDFLLPLLTAEKEHKGPIEIFYKGKKYTISNKHKAILTGNPEFYPGRHLHENINITVYLKVWTRDSLQKQILQPLQELENRRNLSAPEKRTLEKLLTAFIEVSRLISTAAADKPQPDINDPSCPVTNEYFSVRDAKQCFLRYFYHTAQGASLEQAAYEACILEWGYRFSPEQAEHFKAKMQKIFKPKLSEIKDFNTDQNAKDFLGQLPADLYLSAKQREWLVSIHENMELQKSYAHHLDEIDGTPAIKWGTLMEGNSGLGKSRIALALLQAKGFQEISVSQLLESKPGVDLSQCYIQFSASGNFKNDQQILLRAFDTGCKVILDELNLDPKLERVLNQLLTGKTKQGQTAKISGFYIFACQNSAKHAGSKPISPALYSRFHVLYTELNQNDLVEIIKDGFQKNTLAKPDSKEIAAILASYNRMQLKHPHAVNMRRFYIGLQKIIDKKLQNRLRPKDKREKVITHYASTANKTITLFPAVETSCKTSTDIEASAKSELSTSSTQRNSTSEMSQTI